MTPVSLSRISRNNDPIITPDSDFKEFRLPDPEAVAGIIQNALVTHAAKLPGKSTAVNTEECGEVIPVEAVLKQHVHLIPGLSA